MSRPSECLLLYVLKRKQCSNSLLSNSYCGLGFNLESKLIPLIAVVSVSCWLLWLYRVKCQEGPATGKWMADREAYLFNVLCLAHAHPLIWQFSGALHTTTHHAKPCISWRPLHDETTARGLCATEFTHIHSNCHSDTLKYHNIYVCTHHTHLFTSFAQGSFIYYMDMLHKPVLYLNLYPPHYSSYTRLILVS